MIIFYREYLSLKYNRDVKMEEYMQIAFIGTGVMGAPMCRNLLKHGHELTVYNRTTAKAQALIGDGAKVALDIAQCVKDANVVITMVGYPKDVSEVYDKVLESVKPKTVLIDMTTSSPKLAIELAQKAKEKDVYMLDAPVSGGDIGAINGTLTIMVGGKREVFDSVHSVFEAMGTTINYIGDHGSGQHCKMANQIAIAGAIAGVMEMITYGQRVNLDIETMLKAVSKGSAASAQMESTTKKILANDYRPGFYIKHFIKDMQIAEAEAQRRHLVLPILSQVLKEFEELEDRGYGDLGTQALIKYYLES